MNPKHKTLGARALLALARKHKRLAGPLRILHYNFWRLTGVTGFSGMWPELKELRDIVERSDPSTLAAREGGRRILVITFRNWTTHVTWDALTAHALRARGADVQVFTCGGRLPICDIATRALAPPMPCNTCAPYITQVLDNLRLPHTAMRDYITGSEQREIEREVNALRPDQYQSFQFDGLPLGELVRPSLQWFMLTGNLQRDRETEEAYRRFLISAAWIARIADRVLDAARPEVIYLLNGIVFAERIFIERARQRGITFITHDMGFMPDAQVFTRNGFAPHYDLTDVWPSFAGRPLTDNESRRLDAYLQERETGRCDATVYYPKIEADAAIVASQLGLDRNKGIATLFTNVDFDTAAYSIGAAFPTMEQWLRHTVDFFAARPDRQLVIRIHPAEIRLPFMEPRNKAADMIRNVFGRLPENIKMVLPDSDISSYALMELSRFAIVYGSTTGLEMALRGKPVVVGGRSYYGRLGFTYDARDPDDYDALLEAANVMKSLDVEKVELARRYASLFFFRHHLDFPLTKSTRDTMSFTFRNLDSLRPGRNASLDLICDAILHDRPLLNTADL